MNKTADFIVIKKGFFFFFLKNEVKKLILEISLKLFTQVNFNKNSMQTALYFVLLCTLSERRKIAFEFITAWFRILFFKK